MTSCRRRSCFLGRGVQPHAALLPFRVIACPLSDQRFDRVAEAAERPRVEVDALEREVAVERVPLPIG